jgi:hypothetical protein
MGFLDIFSAITKGLVSPVVGYFNNKQQISAQLQTNKLKALQAAGDRQAQLISQGMAETASWEMASLQAGQDYRGFELIVLSIPVVMCFTHWAYIVENGFRALSLTPGWFQTIFITVYMANYGIRVGHAVSGLAKKIVGKGS